MGINKNFVIKNGLEVDENLLYVDYIEDKVGIKTAIPNYELEVIGGIGASTITVSDTATVNETLNVGVGGTVLSSSSSTGRTGLGIASPDYVLDVRSPVSTGQTALYVYGDARITGDLFLDDINLDLLTATNVSVAQSVTANDYYGDGSNLTGLVSIGLVIALGG